MNSDALTLAQHHVSTGKALSGLDPSRLNLLATDPDVAAQHSELSKQAQNFLLTAQPYWWANYPDQHPSVTGIPWSFGSGTTTGTSSLTQLQQNLGLGGQNGASTQPTGVVQPVTAATEPVPDFDSGMSEVLRLVNLKTPESYQLADEKYNLLLQFHPNQYHKSLDSLMQALGLQRPTATSGLTEISMDELMQRRDVSMEALGQEITRRNQIYTPELAAQRPGYFQSQLGTLSAVQPVPSETPAIDQVITDTAAAEVPIAESRDVTQRVTRGRPSTGTTGTTGTVETKPTRDDVSSGITVTDTTTGRPTREEVSTGGEGADTTKSGRGTGAWISKANDWITKIAGGSPAQWIESIAEYGQYVDPTGILFTADKIFDAYDVLKAVDKGDWATAISEGLALYGPVEGMYDSGGKLLTAPQLFGGSSKEALKKIAQTYYQQRIKNSIPETRQRQTEAIFTPTSTSLTERQEESGIETSTEVFDKGKRKEGEDPAGPEGRVKTDIGAELSPYPKDTEISLPTYEPPVLETGPLQDAQTGGYPINYAGKGEAFLQLLADQGDTVAADELAQRKRLIAQTPEPAIEFSPDPEEVVGLPAEPVLEPVTEVIPAEFEEIPEVEPISFDFNYSTADESTLRGWAQGGNQQAQNELDSRTEFYQTTEGVVEPETALTTAELSPYPEPIATEPTPTGAEDMADLAKARRDYFEQYEAPAIRAQSEQERSALGQLRGQMMARQGLMGSPLGVGLGVQQEAQMRGLAMQEVGRGRSAMELQLAEQRYRADQASADRALQAEQFGVTTGLQEQEIELRRKQLEGTLGLERAAQDIRKEEFGTTTALQQVGQNLQEREYLSNLRLHQAQQGLQEQQLAGTLKREEIDQRFRDRQLDETLGIEQTDQEIRQQQFTDTLALQKIDQALQQKQFDANWAMQELEMVLKQRQVDNTQLLQEADLAYRNRLQEFNEAQAKFQRSVTKEQQQNNREELDNATRRLNQADKDRKTQQSQFDKNWEQRNKIANDNKVVALANGLATIVASEHVWDIASKLFKGPGEAQDLKEALENLQQGIKNLDNQPMLPGSEVGGPDYVAPDYQPEETVEFSPDPTYQPEEVELSPMPEEVELSPMPEEVELSPMPEEVESKGSTWQLQTESGSGGRMYGVFGTPTAEDVGDKLKTIMATEMVSIGDAIGRLLEGFEEGYRQNEGAEVGRGSPTTKMRLMMDDLSNMRSSATGALRPDEVFAVINKHLSGSAGLETATPTTNGTATIGTEAFVSPDYQAHQQKMVDDLIMMADYEYDDNAMIAQFNKTDIRRLIGAARGASPPFNLTARQKMSLNKMVSQPWFQAAVGQQGGNI
jgi:hypothetical protein